MVKECVWLSECCQVTNSWQVTWLSAVFEYWSQFRACRTLDMWFRDYLDHKTWVRSLDYRTVLLLQTLPLGHSFVVMPTLHSWSVDTSTVLSLGECHISEIIPVWLGGCYCDFSPFVSRVTLFYCSVALQGLNVPQYIHPHSLESVCFQSSVGDLE